MIYGTRDLRQNVSYGTTATGTTASWADANVIVNPRPRDAYEQFLEAVHGPRCTVCRKRGPGMIETSYGLPVHRWPCRDRLL